MAQDISEALSHSKTAATMIIPMLYTMYTSVT